MTRYVFDNPDAMFKWIDEVAFKLLTIPRDEFGKIEINITRTQGGATWGFLIEPKDKERWRKLKEYRNEKTRN